MVDPLLTRRLFLADLGKGAVAVAVLGVTGSVLAACAGPDPTVSPGTSGSPSSSADPTGSAPSSDTGTGSTTPGSPAPDSAASGGPGAPGGVAWSRVNLGFVSAYVLVRDGEATIVDTGVAGSLAAIEATMSALDLGWSDVGNVILTHKHADHAGSIDAVLAANPEIVGWIGAADLPGVTTTRPLMPLADGDEVFGLRIIATPGHTAGHVSVLDEAGGVLVAGDALGTVGGPLTGSNPQFTADATAARASVVKLGSHQFETLLVGHGEPIRRGASAQVRALGGG